MAEVSINKQEVARMTRVRGYRPGMVKTLEGLPGAGLAEDDRQDAEAAARDVLTEVTQPEPNRGKIRRALSSLKGFLAPIAMSLAEGGAEGSAHEWARMAIEQLGRPF
jgi:hypothetical protein